MCEKTIEHLKKFKEYLKLENYSNDTYYNLIKLFLKETEEQEITEEIINAFILRKKEGSATETVNGYIKALRIYLKFLNKEIKTPKIIEVEQKIPDSFTLEFLEKEIMPVVDSIFEEAFKIKTILYFMFYTGIRIPSEILSLQRKNINIKNRTAKIYAKKTKNEQLKIFPKKLATMLNKYFTFEPEENNAFNLTVGKIAHIFKSLKPHFKTINIRPTLFRHSYCTHLLKQGADITIIQKLVGHKSIASTFRYLGTNDTLLKEMYDKYM